MQTSNRKAAPRGLKRRAPAALLPALLAAALAASTATAAGLPGPPGSDRAYEQVSPPDAGGNPIVGGLGFADDGNGAYYQVLGGLSQGNSGSFAGIYYAERTASGWVTRTDVLPPRSELAGLNWTPPMGSSALSTVVSVNHQAIQGGQSAAFALRTDGPPRKLVEATGDEYQGLVLASDDGSRVVEPLRGQFDPRYPAAASSVQLYDIGSGAARLASLLPGNAVATCGVGGPMSIQSLPAEYLNPPRRATHYLSADGSLLFFTSQGNDCGGEAHLYMRDFEQETTTEISPPPVSGPACGSALIKSTPGAVFFWTQARLTADDSEISGACSVGEQTGSAKGGDVYRYALTSGSLECVTCGFGGEANVLAPGGSEGAGAGIAVAEDGSRVYFTTLSRLLPDAPAEGTRAIYRVNVGSGALASVGPLPSGQIGDNPKAEEGITPDGAVIVFQSSGTALNSLTGSDNGGTAQYYRYDDRDRTLVCVSCPQDGSPPRAGVAGAEGGLLALAGPGPNMTALDAAGDVFFRTPTALVPEDRNTAAAGEDPTIGTDDYEWRDGRLLLITDGQSRWVPGMAPDIAGVTPSGRDVFFDAAAQYTPDAVDATRRLYDARIGGGFEFPSSLDPCAVGICPGGVGGGPEEASPGTATYAGAGNPRPRRCRHGRVRRKGRCVSRPRHHRHHRRHGRHRRPGRSRAGQR